MEKPTPRINAPLRENFIGQTVRIIGKPLQVQDTSVLLEANGQILVNKTRDKNVHPTNVVEVLGKVNEDLSIQMITSIDFGNNIDFNMVDALVDILHQNREIFY